MEHTHWELGAKVRAEDGKVYIPYEYLGNGTKDAYAIMVGDTVDKYGQIRKFVIKDYYVDEDDFMMIDLLDVLERSAQ